MYTTSIGSVAESLRSYGEESTAEWVLSCSEEQLVRICSVAYWLIFHGPKNASGGVLLAKMEALAAVYVRHGVPRDTARKRRDLRAGRPEASEATLERRPDDKVAAEVPEDYGVGEDLRSFWEER